MQLLTYQVIKYTNKTPPQTLLFPLLFSNTHSIQPYPMLERHVFLLGSLSPSSHHLCLFHQWRNLPLFSCESFHFFFFPLSIISFLYFDTFFISFTGFFLYFIIICFCFLERGVIFLQEMTFSPPLLDVCTPSSYRVVKCRVW